MKNFSFLIPAFVLLMASQVASSQIISLTPSLPNDLDAVEVIFDATQGNGGLAGYTGDIYAHTGVLTNLSTSPTDWKYVKADWGVNIPDCKLISLGNDKWKLSISPNIRQYYGVPAGEQINKLAFVFRSSIKVNGNWLEGKTSTGGDIFYDVFQAVLSVKITNPDQDFLFTGLNHPFTISVASLLADSTFLYSENQLLAAVAGNSLNYTLTPDNYGRVLIKAIAKAGTQSVADSFYYYVRGAVPVAEVPQGITEGINYLDDHTVVLCLYAPLKEFVYAIGDFNNWLPDEAFYMNRTPDGKRYWVQLSNLQAGKEYLFQYYVDGEIRTGDPYARKVSDPWNDSYINTATYPGLIPYPIGKTSGIATSFQTAQTAYNWKSGAFTPASNTDLVIYELLIRDFTDRHTFQSVIDSIHYFKKLGVNAIELMPVSEFEGNISWGYNPNYYFAVDKYYGPANKLKQLIDTCHSNGIAVISDIVLNHAFGSSPYVMLYWDKANNRPAANSPFYNPVAKHDFNVGYDMNHESPDTKIYISRILRYWLEEFRFDGYRFDLSKGFTQKNTLGNTGAWGNYDPSRINILSAYYDTIKAVNHSALLILEHFADNSEETILANRGMLLWGNMNYNFGEAAMGYNESGKSDFSWTSYKNRGWSQPNLVAYMESHDEERMMFRNVAYGNSSGSYLIKDTVTALKRAALSTVFFIAVPGPKMIWQFGERGYDYSINYPTGTSASRLDQKPPRWDYMRQYERVKLFDIYASLIKFKTGNPIFKATDFSMDVNGAMKKIKLRYGDVSAVILGNFGVTAGNINPAFYNTGKWYEFFTSDSLDVTSTDGPINLAPGEYRMYLNQRYPFPYSVPENTSHSLTIDVFPNPAAEVCHIRVNPVGYQYSKIYVCDISGRLVADIFSGIIKEKTIFDWYPAVKGVFLVRMQHSAGVEVKKLVVE